MGLLRRARIRGVVTFEKPVFGLDVPLPYFKLGETTKAKKNRACDSVV